MNILVSLLFIPFQVFPNGCYINFIDTTRCDFSPIHCTFDYAQDAIAHQENVADLCQEISVAVDEANSCIDDWNRLVPDYNDQVDLIDRLRAKIKRLRKKLRRK